MRPSLFIYMICATKPLDSPKLAEQPLNTLNTLNQQAFAYSAYFAVYLPNLKNVIFGVFRIGGNFRRVWEGGRDLRAERSEVRGEPAPEWRLRRRGGR